MSDMNTDRIENPILREIVDELNEEENPRIEAQWFNWGNWGNWRNWVDWHNWGNWGNWANWWNSP